MPYIGESELRAASIRHIPAVSEAEADISYKIRHNLYGRVMDTNESMQAAPLASLGPSDLGINVVNNPLTRTRRESWPNCTLLNDARLHLCIRLERELHTPLEISCQVSTISVAGLLRSKHIHSSLVLHSAYLR